MQMDLGIGGEELSAISKMLSHLLELEVENLERLVMCVWRGGLPKRHRQPLSTLKECGFSGPRALPRRRGHGTRGKMSKREVCDR
jgi:hypothetical protein